MGLTSYCRNCGEAKDLATYAENYCTACTTAIREAREFAIKENVDVGQATRSALAQRAHDIHNNRPDPFKPITKADYWANKTNEAGVVVLVVALLILMFAPVLIMVGDALF